MKFNYEGFFKAIGDPNRVKILKVLRSGEMCVTDICKYFKMTQPSVSHHLGILKKAGILKSRKDGKEVYYSVDCCCICDCCADFSRMFGKGK